MYTDEIYNNITIADCEKCGKKKVPVLAASMTDTYCIDCMRLAYEEFFQAEKKVEKFHGEDDIGECEFCGRDGVPVMGTFFSGCYCADCFKIARNECSRAKIALRQYHLIHKIPFTTSVQARSEQELTKSKKRADDALVALGLGDDEEEEESGLRVKMVWMKPEE